MVIDTSALLAILQDEPERRIFNETIVEADVRLLSTANFVEASMVVAGRYGPAGLENLDSFIDCAELRLIPVDVEQSHRAREAFQRFGKGNHPAALNFGDCFAYALAKSRRESLLFKGNDFSQTDIEAAV